jgi:hypothetical protein
VRASVDFSSAKVADRGVADRCVVDGRVSDGCVADGRVSYRRVADGFLVFYRKDPKKEACNWVPN